MPTHVALLRAINVGGHNSVAMSDLRALFATLQPAQAKTLLQSGNVVFQGGRRSPAALERLLEAETTGRLGLSVDYLVRTAAEWEQIVAHNPFPDEAERDPGRLVVMFLKAAPKLEDVAALQTAIKGPELLLAAGKQLYVVYPDGIGRSKLSGSLIEKQLCRRGTGRNWNTVLKLAALLRE